MKKASRKNPAVAVPAKKSDAAVTGKQPAGRRRGSVTGSSVSFPCFLPSTIQKQDR